MATAVATPEQLEEQINKSQEAVQQQGDLVRSLKANVKDGKAQQAEVDAAIKKLQELKLVLGEHQKAFEKATGKTSSQNKEAFRANLTNTLERRLFYIPSFKIYGSVAGFYDYGPPGCAIKQNLTQAWRQHFVLEENMLEVECPAVTPEAVLKASGHVERFTDFMVTDEKTGDCYRADHLLEAAIEAALEDTKNPLSPQAKREAEDMLAGVGEMKAADLDAALAKYNVVAPDTKNPIGKCFPFNLMFKTSIGPKGDLTGYLRPETAQGIFVNFRDLLYFNGGKLPFAAAQIGNAYRNEISPRAGLLRVREFTQAEIEHFVNPEDKRHPKFANIADLQPLLYSRAMQMGEERKPQPVALGATVSDGIIANETLAHCFGTHMPGEEKKPQPVALGAAVSDGIIANETLAYFIGRTWLFFCRAGVDPKRMRFRQHLQHEMAHYAEDCWDAEVETSYGWVECAGLADRSAYDLRAHTTASKTELTAYEKFPEPREVEELKVTANKKELGVAFKKDAKTIADALEALPEDEADCLRKTLESGKPGSISAGGNTFEITAAMCEIKRVKKKLAGRNYVPSVIEPSFGIGRILYCIFEHSYYTREGDESRAVFKFTPLIAPVKATVFPLLQKQQLNEPASALSRELTAVGLSNIIDTTGTSIGKRYARTDEIGVPYALTVDYDTLQDKCVTLRERDTMTQVRVPVADVPMVVRKLVDSQLSWQEVAAKYPQQKAAEEEQQ